MTISERLTMLLEERGVTKKKVAEACGITPAAISVWTKSNVDSIPSSCIMPICELLQVDPKVLLYDHPQEDDPASGTINIATLRDDEKKLIELYRQTDWEGQHIILASAVSEVRRAAEKAVTDQPTTDETGSAD